MPDFHDLLSEEADHQRPSSNRPFGELVKARRRRDRTTRIAAVGSIGAAVVAGVALAGNLTGPGGRSSVIGDGQPTPTMTRDVSAGDRPLCSIRQLDVSLDWVPQADGSLSGTLVVKNPIDSQCRLEGKPQVIPLSNDGKDAAVTQSQALEKGTDVVLLPGYVSTSKIAWDSWCGGDTLSGQLMVFVNANATTDPASVVIQPRTLRDALGERIADIRHPSCSAGENSNSFISMSFFGGAFDPAPTDPGAPGQVVTGRLELTGGPAGNRARGVQGTVSATGSDGETYDALVGTSGYFKLRLPSGRYTLTGHSPTFGDGTYTCRAANPITVGGDGPAEVNDEIVACSMR